LGHLRKDQVRQLARELELATADKPESQDLCFVEKGGSYRSALTAVGVDRSAEAPGEIVDAAGAVLGRHDGISGFTVGQRKGLGIAADRPLYVLKIDPPAHRIVVGDSEQLLRDTALLERVRWIPFDRPSGPLRATVRIRSAHEGAEASITDHGDGTASVRFDDAQRSIAPGQAAVAYDGDRVLGGGWIREVPWS